MENNDKIKNDIDKLEVLVFNWGDITVTACSEQGSFAKPHRPAAACPDPYSSNMPTD